MNKTPQTNQKVSAPSEAVRCECGATYLKGNSHPDNCLERVKQHLNYYKQLATDLSWELKAAQEDAQ